MRGSAHHRRPRISLRSIRATSRASPPAVADFIEPLRQAVIEEQPADQRLADPGDELQHLHRLDRADRRR